MTVLWWIWRQRYNALAIVLLSIACAIVGTCFIIGAAVLLEQIGLLP